MRKMNKEMQGHDLRAAREGKKGEGNYRRGQSGYTIY